MTPTETYADVFRRHSRPLEPIATGESPRLHQLPGIRAVLFDVYGTLLVSGSGEVGTAADDACRRSLVEALAAVGIPASATAGQGADHFLQAIAASHAASRRAGIEYPEVDIVDIWQKVLAELGRQGGVATEVCRSVDLRRLAVEYEARANPCWPMPHLRECLGELSGAGLLLGIVSNAQFYTRDLFEALLGEPVENCGFDPKLQYYSYQYGSAKPGLDLFRLAAEALGERGIAAAEALYVGNDMLNDVIPAQALGFRTALFAGDARSLRRRIDDPRTATIEPDLVLTDLTGFSECMIS